MLGGEINREVRGSEAGFSRRLKREGEDYSFKGLMDFACSHDSVFVKVESLSALALDRFAHFSPFSVIIQIAFGCRECCETT